jgi:fructosamine-3-kinase
MVNSQPVAGGCINNGAIIQLDNGTTFFIKQNFNAPPNMFEREYQGLIALRTNPGPHVPLPLYFTSSFLLMEDLRPASPLPDYWTQFGSEMAELHSTTHSQFGFDQHNFIGSTPQPNPWTPDGHQFFAEHRLRYQAELAANRGLLKKSDLSSLETIIHRLPELVPVQPASLIHGDLWSGNATSDENGAPAIIDPAAHYGWAEAELGMTTLFGRFPDRFYQSYLERRPLEPGWEDRLDLYNIYHMLNHVNLFGGGYLSGVRSLIKKYS